MSNAYKATPGSYREVTVQWTSIEDVVPPSIKGSETYFANYVVEHKTRDAVNVYGRNGALTIDVDKGSYSLLQRLKSAINMIRGRNIVVQGGAPDKKAIEEHAVIQQYLADSDAFRKLMDSKKTQKDVLTDKRFIITAKGVQEVPLEDRLPK